MDCPNLRGITDLFFIANNAAKYKFFNNSFAKELCFLAANL
jgi:hypothetical protein